MSFDIIGLLTIVVVAIIALAIIALIWNAFWLWWQSILSNAPVSLLQIIFMRFRKVNPAIIVRVRITAKKAGIDLSADELEAHYLAGGDVERVVQALISALKANITLSYDRSCAIDLAGRDVKEAVGTSVNPKVIDVPSGAMARANIDAIAGDGIQLKVKARVTVRTNLDRLVGGATEETIVAPYTDWAQHLDINVNSFIVVASRGHWFDDVALESALTTRARYVGLLGSRRKTLMIYQRLLQEGVPRERLAQVRAPIGLDIGALEPEELAVSIMSEVIMARRGGKGSPMTMDDWYLERAERRANRAMGLPAD